MTWLGKLYKPAKYVTLFGLEEALDDSIENFLSDRKKRRKVSKITKFVLKGFGLGLGIFIAEETLDKYLSAHAADFYDATEPLRDFFPYGAELAFLMREKIPNALIGVVENPAGAFALGAGTVAAAVYLRRRAAAKHGFCDSGPYKNF